MARRSVTGQLNMFDLFNSIDSAEPGEVEMVSLVPDFEEEPVEAVEPVEVVETVEVVEEPTKSHTDIGLKDISEEKVSMSRSYVVDGKKVEIAYINYNKVRITMGEEAPVIKEFTSTKEAVDYYVEKMQELESDE